MHLLFTCALSLVSWILSQGASAPRAVSPGDAAAPMFVLVGDSTVTETDGWGLGFRQLARWPGQVVNVAANGRSSKSYRDEGRWDDALARRGRYYLIQFGHNDEPGKGPDRETDAASTFVANLSRYVDDVRAIGATPVLVTSLTRRQFDAAGRLRDTQAAYVAATRAVAAAKGVPLVDLNRLSRADAERLGPAALEALSARTDAGAVDTTHLNAAGSLEVARLVIPALKAAVPPVAGAFVDAVVAADGSGQYATIQDAINAVPQTTSAARRWTIAVRPGVYREVVYIQREKRFVSLVGDDPATTILTFDLNATMTGLDGKPIGTFRTPTMTVDADDFAVENLTIRNSAGPVGQALALRVDGDRGVYRNLRLLGYQDTLFLNRGRQWFEDTYVAGHVDFIFGGATAYFARCHLHVWRDGYVTAASTPAEAPFGLVFADGRITGESATTHVYLGRPWRDFGHVTFLRTEMAPVVRPEGWHNWDRPERERTARFEEYASTGPGGHADRRVTWSRQLTATEAARITPAAVLGGADHWDPARVPAYPSPRKATAAPLPTPADVAAPVAGASVAWDDILKQPAAWYASAEAVRVAANVLAWQRASGGWPKNTDMAAALDDAARTALDRERATDDATIDNGATVTQIRLLARVYDGAREERFRVAALRGLAYLGRAQYANGGWPQYFPLRTDYSRHITFNDDAMIGVLALFEDVAAGRPPFAAVDAARRAESREAIARARTLILSLQIGAPGARTGWCQQYDAVTLAPAAARAYEHVSISAKETVSIVRYLMGIETPDAVTREAIESAVAWLKGVAIPGRRVERVTRADAPKGYDLALVDDPAAPPLWARFYEIGTNRPIYSGRDGVVRYRFDEIDVERRTGYSWLSDYAATLLARDYPAWQRRVTR